MSGATITAHAAGISVRELMIDGLTKVTNS